MSKLTRRDFIKSSMIAGASLAVATPFSKVRGANNDIRVAVIGVGGKGRFGGTGHCSEFHKIEGVRVVAVCDADQDLVDRAVEDFKKQNVTVKGYRDMRKILGDKEIDAISTATPDQWHALVTIWGCQAGKDVYVEKPTSHNIWEGRKMVEAARKYNRIVQNGTMRRSSDAYREAYEYINQGNIGKILWVRGFCYKDRFVDPVKAKGVVPGTGGPNPVPASVDYNLWCGPADMEPLRRKTEQFHYFWHWFWDTGCGDLGNQGAHEVDESRWAIGDPKMSEHVISIGGRFAFNDIAETANTQIAFYDYKPAPIIFEVRGLPSAKDQKLMDNYRGIRIGVVVQCEDGYFAAGEGGGWIYDNDDNKIKQFAGSGGGGHFKNFIDAVRNRKVSDLNADIEVGHNSAALCHMGNISYRLGQKMPADKIKEAIGDNVELMDSFNRMLEHLKANEVDLEKEPIIMGPMLTMDPEKERFVGEYSDMANMYLKRNYREPFVVPDKV
jgi:predicted dehydrogenase